MPRCGVAEAQAGQRHHLLTGHGTGEPRTHLEQGAVLLLAREIARGRSQEVGQQRGPHRRQLGVERVALQHRLRGTEQRRLLGRDERPGDRLGVAQIGHGPAHGRAAALGWGEQAVADGGPAGDGYRCDSVVAVQPGQLLDDAGLGRHVVAPGRRLHGHASGPAGEAEAEPAPWPRSPAGQLDARQSRQPCAPERDSRCRCRLRPRPRRQVPVRRRRSWRISRVANSVAGSTSSGSNPRSKRVRASLSIPSRRPVAAVRSGSNSATSRITSVVNPETPVLSPPMMPPRLTGPAASAITVVPSSSR